MIPQPLNTINIQRCRYKYILTNLNKSVYTERTTQTNEHDWEFEESYKKYNNLPIPTTV